MSSIFHSKTSTDSKPLINSHFCSFFALISSYLYQFPDCKDSEKNSRKKKLFRKLERKFKRRRNENLRERIQRPKTKDSQSYKQVWLVCFCSLVFLNQFSKLDFLILVNYKLQPLKASRWSTFVHNSLPRVNAGKSLECL